MNTFYHRSWCFVSGEQPAACRGVIPEVSTVEPLHSVRYVIPREHFTDRLQDDFGVEERRPMLQVLDVERDLIGDGELISAVDLSPTGQARHERLDPLFRSQGDEVILVK